MVATTYNEYKWLGDSESRDGAREGDRTHGAPNLPELRGANMRSRQQGSSVTSKRPWHHNCGGETYAEIKDNIVPPQTVRYPGC